MAQKEYKMIKMFMTPNQRFSYIQTADGQLLVQFFFCISSRLYFTRVIAQSNPYTSTR